MQDTCERRFRLNPWIAFVHKSIRVGTSAYRRRPFRVLRCYARGRPIEESQNDSSKSYRDYFSVGEELR